MKLTQDFHPQQNAVPLTAALDHKMGSGALRPSPTSLANPSTQALYTLGSNALESRSQSETLTSPQTTVFSSTEISMTRREPRRLTLYVWLTATR